MCNLYFLYMNVGKANSLKQGVLVLKADHDIWSRDKNWHFTILQPRSCLCIWGMHLLITLLLCKRSEEQTHIQFSRIKGKTFLKLHELQSCSYNKKRHPLQKFLWIFLPFGNVSPHPFQFAATGLVTCSERQVHELFSDGNSRKDQMKTFACSSSSFFF